ncbi:DUF1642 domain-containing protein [Oenococcus sicerae]|uniref:DUF1642 domain-containing protein n=1 Tax=Oenococcus sicerae TaxID=2203724 RepID=A0AAJ1VLJ6_9LACO|nr:DUF1642 domain-containing protein [Oenococcus sicerae]MDN6899558.1 DUF1642 domain-containing protein [Oenococcus sicerae]
MFKKVGYVQNMYQIGHHSGVEMYQYDDNKTDENCTIGKNVVEDNTPVYIHEPVKLPKYVADYLAKVKNNDLAIQDLFIFIIRPVMESGSPEIKDWFENTDNAGLMIAEAILYGYEIEDEK